MSAAVKSSFVFDLNSPQYDHISGIVRSAMRDYLAGWEVKRRSQLKHPESSGPERDLLVKTFILDSVDRAMEANGVDVSTRTRVIRKSAGSSER